MYHNGIQFVCSLCSLNLLSRMNETVVANRPISWTSMADLLALICMANISNRVD